MVKISYEFSNECIHVWGANEGNWNNNYGEPIVGDGQAKAMKNQQVGVFGIVTMPTRDATLILQPDKTKYL